jgi:hypothetical protein
MGIFLAPLLLAVSLLAFAQVGSKIHKLCIKAKDYSSCIRENSNQSIGSSKESIKDSRSKIVTEKIA